MGENRHARQRASSPRLGLIAGLQALGAAAVDLRYSVVHLLAFNVIWFLASLPLITLPSATIALYVVAQKISYRRAASVGDFFAAMREYWWISWRWMLISVVAAAIMAVNVLFYRSWDNAVGLVLIGLWIGIALIWGVVQLYVIPILLEQDRPFVRTALRNALVLSLRHPFYTMTCALWAGFLSVISVILPFLWAMLTPALLAYFYSRAVYHLVRVEQGRDPNLEPESFDV